MRASRAPADFASFAAYNSRPDQRAVIPVKADRRPGTTHERNHMKRSVHALSGIPWISTTTRVMGEKQIATFELMCERTGRKPFELASDIVLGELWEAGDSPQLRKLARKDRSHRLHAVRDIPDATTKGTT